MSRCDLDCNTTINVCDGESLQEAYDKLATDYDMRGYSATFMLDSGTYTPLSMTKPLVGGNAIILDGNGLSISGNGKPAIGNYVNGVSITIKNLKMAGWNGGAGCTAMYGGRINLREGITFGAGNAEHILACYGGQVSISDDYAVTGGAVTHWHSYSDGYITATNLTVNITAGIWFSSRWAGVADASLIARDCIYTNGSTVHGSKYLVHKNGFMEIGANVLPGDSAGVIATGGVVA